MRAAFAIAALAGAAIAAPTYGSGSGNQEEPKKNLVVVVETVIETCYVTEGYPIPSATPAPEPVPAPAAPTTTIAPEAPKPSSAYVEPPQTPVYEAPAPLQPAYSAPAYTPAPAPAPGPGLASNPEPKPAPPANSGYMSVVSEWRSKMGLPNLTQDSKLESNALDTLISDPTGEKHKMNPGTYGQTIGPRDTTDFTKVFVGGWLCELPNAAGLNGVCDQYSAGIARNGVTLHAEITTSTQYTKIGCALHLGFWCCDFA